MILLQQTVFFPNFLWYQSGLKLYQTTPMLLKFLNSKLLGFQVLLQILLLAIMQYLNSLNPINSTITNG